MSSMDKLLSIIVPSYNMEAYLPKCLGSLVIVPEMMERLEVLVVNDGSKDRTSEIAHEFATRWPATFKVIDKTNGNYGSCINRGLAEATGTFIKILDADDTFDTNAFAEFLAAIVKTEAEHPGEIDMFLSDKVTVDETGSATASLVLPLPPRTIFPLEEIDLDVQIEMHCVAFRASLLRANGYRQTEGISYTDTEWATVPLIYAHKAVYIPLSIYRYLYGRAGQTCDTDVSLKNRWMLLDVMINIMEKYADAVNTLAVARKKVLERQFFVMMRKNIYSSCLLKDGCDENCRAKLIRLEELLRDHAPAVYDDCGKLQYVWHGIRMLFVDNWRKQHDFNSATLRFARFLPKFSLCLGRVLAWTRLSGRHGADEA